MKKKCPYWNATDKRCAISKNGLFIPLEGHITIYCTTAEHTSCQQFKQGPHLPESRKNRISSFLNRRRHQRIQRRVKINLVQLNDSGNIVQNYAGISSTIDLSPGGMQISSRDPLMNDSIINYSFGRSFPASLQSGLARVKWCHYRKENFRYSAGLAFQNNYAAKAVQSTLETPNPN